MRQSTMHSLRIGKLSCLYELLLVVTTPLHLILMEYRVNGWRGLLGPAAPCHLMCIIHCNTPASNRFGLGPMRACFTIQCHAWHAMHRGEAYET